MKLLTVIGLVVGLLTTSKVFADAASSAEAKAHAERAFAAFGLHKFEDAAREYERAFELKPDPALLFNAAQANRYANQKKRAVELYESYTRMYPRTKNIDEVRQLVEKLKQAMAEDDKNAMAPPKELKSAEPSDVEEKPAQAAAPVREQPASTSTTAHTTSSSSNVLVSGPPPKKPIYKKSWFWGVVAGGAVVVAGAVVLGVVLGGGPGSPPVPAGGIVQGN